MRCLLFDHEPVREEGVGEYKGRSSTFCRHCGKMFSMEGHAPALEQTTRDPLQPERMVTQ